MNNRKGLFIVIEGVDGSGKTTQANLLAESFKKIQKNPVILTSEPWEHTKTGRLIRKYMAKDSTDYVNDEIFSKLFAANRLQHMDDPEHGICKLLDDGYVVISDRSVISSIVYQPDFATKDNSKILNNGKYCPDMVILLTMDSDVAIERMKSRNKPQEYYENMNTIKEQQTAYKEATFALMNRYIIQCRDLRKRFHIKDVYDKTKFVNDHIMIVNGNKDVQEVHKEIITKIFHF